MKKNIISILLSIISFFNIQAQSAENPGFWERRAMEVLPIIVLTLIIGFISAMSGYISRMTKQNNEKNTTESISNYEKHQLPNMITQKRKA